MVKKQVLRVSIGIFAHNEEINIERAVKSIQNSRLKLVEIETIIVVSSGSYDRTNLIVNRLKQKDKRIRLVPESQRLGKASAVNQFIRHAVSPILVTMSADLSVSSRAIETICVPFIDPEIGMVGAHPSPQPTKGGTINREIKLLWQLHHEISQIRPKCGEMVAFRNIIRQIPPNSAVDEANIEVLLTLLGYKVVYAPKAIVYNKGPRNIKEFLIQRRRVEIGHEWVRKRYNYRVVTTVPSIVAATVIRHVRNNPQDVIVMLRLLVMELTARILGLTDFHLLGRNPYKWQMIER